MTTLLESALRSCGINMLGNAGNFLMSQIKLVCPRTFEWIIFADGGIM